ncbi:transposase [Clostridium sp. AM33-3]|uniref:IS110 family transposase n=1 Tax=Clostridium sp. AM33-3 TaxID=2292304 RepID=UPI00325B24C4
MIVGIDVGSETHYARAFDWRNYEYTKKPLEFSNTEAGFLTFKAWMEDLAEKHGKNVVIPGMEPTGHYWFALGKFLQDNGMKPVHVNPHHVKKSKELDDNSPSKNDRKDPKTIAALVNEGRFSYPYIPTGIYAEIRSLSNLRFQTQEELTRIKNRIARWFSMHRESKLGERPRKCQQENHC